MEWIRENWFKLFLTVAIAVTGIAVGYYHVFLIPERERQEQEKQDEERFWKNKEEEVRTHIEDMSNLVGSTAEIEQNMRKSLNGLYVYNNDSKYYIMKPTIDASEHYLKTLDAFMQVIQEMQSIAYEKQRIIQIRDKNALNEISQTEDSKNTEFLLLVEQVRREQDEINVLKSEALKNMTL